MRRELSTKFSPVGTRSLPSFRQRSAMVFRYRCFVHLLLLVSVILPAAAQGGHDEHDHEHTGAVCGTALWMQMRLAQDHPELMDDNVRRLMSLIPCSNTRPVKQNSILSSRQHFRIHFDSDGDDAVTALDRNGNGRSDYIDSVDHYLEHAWTQEIEVYGFLAPPPDSRGGGPEIDVFICNLGGQVYGLARPEEDMPTGPNTVSGFLVIDNDYAEPYFSQGYKGLRVTIAHEFHHIVQFSSYRFDLSQSSLYESTSVWFERKLHPDVPDYTQYSDAFLREPHQYGYSTHRTYIDREVTGYAHVLYLSYLEKRLNDRDVVRKIWEEFRNHEIAFDAIDAALRGYSLNLSDSYCEFAQWCYYTGKRARGTTYFPEAASFPTMGAATFRMFGLDDVSLTESRLYPLSFGLYSFSVVSSRSNSRDTVDFLITDARTDFGKGYTSMPKDDFNLELSRMERDGFRPLQLRDSSFIYFRLNAPSPQFCVTPLVGGSAVTLLATVVAPQPFVSDGAADLLFGINLAKDQVSSARLVVYSLSMTPVIEIVKDELETSNNMLGITWKGTDFHGDLVASGIYIYELRINEEPPVYGKIALVRK